MITYEDVKAAVGTNEFTTLYSIWQTQNAEQRSNFDKRLEALEKSRNKIRNSMQMLGVDLR